MSGRSARLLRRIRYIAWERLKVALARATDPSIRARLNANAEITPRVDRSLAARAQVHYVLLRGGDKKDTTLE